MAVQTNTFKGARYVPKFADPIEWSAENSYEAIESVQHNGFTYLSKQPVPAGVQIDNTEFWLEWADPNAQMEQLRQEVDGYVDTVEELSGTVNGLSDGLDAEIENREAADETINAKIDENNLLFSNERNLPIRYVEFAQEGTIAVPDGFYTQGCTFDGEYIYVFITPSSDSTYTYPRLMKVNPANFSTEAVFTFNEYSNIGHGNSINYDSVTDTIVIVSSNYYITRITRDFETVTQTLQANTHPISQFAITDDYMAVNLTGTNAYIFYNRINQNFFAAYGIAEISQARGDRNILQDMCAYNKCCYSLSSASENKNPCIAAFGFNGRLVVTFTAAIDSIEFEGMFFANSKLYIIGSNGQVYTSSASNFRIEVARSLTTYCPDMSNFYDTFISNFVKLDELKELRIFRDIDVDSSANGDNSYITKWQIAFPDFQNPFGDAYQSDIIPFYFGRPVYFGYTVSNGGFRANLQYGNMQVRLDFTLSNKVQRLTTVYMYNGSEYFSQSFGANDTDEDYATKLRNLFTNANIHFPTTSSNQINLSNNAHAFYKVHKSPLKFENATASTYWIWI